MSVERHHEHAERNEAAAAELEAARAEKLEQLRQSAETEDQPEKRAEAAREIIGKHEQAPEPPAVEDAPPEPKPHRPVFDPKQNYAHTMAGIQRQLRPASRQFSKLIHSPVVEKTSEALERTVARPSILLGAIWTALIVGAIFYFTARHYGYALSGSELLFSFIVGAVLGIALEAIFRAARHR